MANLYDETQWGRDQVLVDHLAEQLLKGRLSLFLGAGVSANWGLPDWRTLVNNICDSVGEPTLKPADDPIVKIGAIRAKHFNNNIDGFVKQVHKNLYDGVSYSFQDIHKYELLSAIGALVMASLRGSASKVITLNFDDILETYLEYFGYVVRSVSQDKHWSGIQDLTIYHPHGFLPKGKRIDESDDIVLGSTQYYQIMGSDYWKPLLQTILRTHTTLYIGLSGADQHLQNLLVAMKELHVNKSDRILYHGVLFAKEDEESDDVHAILREWGVYVKIVKEYDDIPKFLFSVCQRARELRVQAL